jgi:hypothetical protein
MEPEDAASRSGPRQEPLTLSQCVWESYSSPAVLLKLLLAAEWNTAGLDFKPANSAIFIHVEEVRYLLPADIQPWRGGPSPRSYLQDRRTSTLTHAHGTRNQNVVTHLPRESISCIDSVGRVSSGSSTL